MSLALELKLGTADELRQRMTERELGQWYAYARKHGGLPSRRVDLMLANIARMSAGADSILAFVFDPSLRESLTPTAVGSAEQGATAISAIVGGARIIKLGVNKRKAANHGG